MGGGSFVGGLSTCQLVGQQVLALQESVEQLTLYKELRLPLVGGAWPLLLPLLLLPGCCKWFTPAGCGTHDRAGKGTDICACQRTRAHTYAGSRQSHAPTRAHSHAPLGTRMPTQVLRALFRWFLTIIFPVFMAYFWNGLARFFTTILIGRSVAGVLAVLVSP